LDDGVEADERAPCRYGDCGSQFLRVAETPRATVAKLIQMPSEVGSRANSDDIQLRLPLFAYWCRPNCEEKNNQPCASRARRHDVLNRHDGRPARGIKTDERPRFNGNSVRGFHGQIRKDACQQEPSFSCKLGFLSVGMINSLFWAQSLHLTQTPSTVVVHSGRSICEPLTLGSARTSASR
jgi:hypothetical protein